MVTLATEENMMISKTFKQNVLILFEDKKLKPAKVRKENYAGIVIDLPDVRKRYMQFPKLKWHEVFILLSVIGYLL